MASPESSKSHMDSIFSSETSSTDHSTEETSTDLDKQPNESSKLRTLLSILRKFSGVADIASVRFSLPAQLLEPIPNLEYWNYFDQPSAFIAVGKSNDALGRMLEVLRFWFTKDLKYVKGKPCKPYNSTLGEFFRCNWEAEDFFPTISELVSISEATGRTSRSKKSSRSSSVATQNINLGSINEKKAKISFLTEQVSHHPPVSAFIAECPEMGLRACGFDQLTARFTGMSVKVTPGEHNLGIYINLTKRDNEEYHLTHPAAHISGFLIGGINVTICEECYITCEKTKIKTILNYIEEGWLGRARNKVEGVIFKYDPNNDHISKIKEVPESDILARISGFWKESVHFSYGAHSKSQIPLIDLTPLNLPQKIVPPMENQLSNESRHQWSSVTDAINAHQYSKATTLKVELEEKERAKAREREKKGFNWNPRFFVGTIPTNGRPELTLEGKEALTRLQEDEWELEEKNM
ncbi:Oxysterol-binding protein-like protein 1 [Golovinomyces cichoracearum]|uniref:Oxysterol-binding protein-like protein 1 n=1 Tax=Golovinomyces cichoracearum TaxID=62708 RepID=A0A420J5Q5_9PEZI|nr:Oxysterol-binding protein-like protein 1 [Golovinomyces cichoracearum]